MDSIWSIAMVCLMAWLPSTMMKVGGQVTNGSLASMQVVTDPFPYIFPDQDVPPQALFPMPSCRNVTLEEATIDQLQFYMNAGALTTVDILNCYLRRYDQVNGYTTAIMQLNPDAMQIAEFLDTERAAGRIRGPLHGIPFVVKDNIATKDSMETTAGSWMLLGSVVPRDAHVVMKLRNAGALLMGHASLSEWADMRSNNYSEGYSPRGGQARSPYNLTVNPGGSSSGSALAVAANQVMFALGK
jgi:amidase